MFLTAKLAWLPGYPLGRAAGTVSWVSLPRRGERPPETVQLSRDQLREASFTWSKLVHRFPKALRYVVEDEERWIDGEPRLLDWLKDTIHHHKPLPASLFTGDDAFSRAAFSHAVVSRAKRLGQAHPGLVPILDALSWCLYLTPADAPEALAWLEAHVGELEELLNRLSGPDGTMTVLMLWELTRRDGERRLRPLVEQLGDERSHTLVMGDYQATLQAWEKALQRARKQVYLEEEPPGPSATLSEPLLDLVAWLTTQNRASRRRALELLGLVLPAALLDRWQSWWQQLETLLKEARRLARSGTTPENDRASRLLQQELGHRRVAQPPPHHAQQIVANIETLAGPQNKHLFREVVTTAKGFPSSPETTEIRAAFLHHWLGLARWQPHEIVALLGVFRHYLQTVDTPTALAPWQHVVAAWQKAHPSQSWGIDDHLVTDLEDRSLWSVAFEAIGLALSSAALDDVEAGAERLIDLVRVGKNAAQAVRRLQALAAVGLHDTYLPEGLLACAHRLDVEQDRFGKLAHALSTMRHGDATLFQGLQALDQAFERAGWPGLVRDLILDGALADVQGASLWLSGLRALVRDVAAPGRDAGSEHHGWQRRYPDEFHTTLADLAAVTAHAEGIADDLLGRYYPTRRALETEIAALERNLTANPGSDSLRRRLETVEARLESYPPAVPESRRRRLGHRLLRRTRREVLRRWERQLKGDLRTELAALLEIEETPEPFLEPRSLRIIAALLELKKPYRDLGLRLLRKRCGPPPWDLHEHPANRAFVDGLTGHGIDVRPWLEPETFVFDVEERTLTLSFERDPLEIFFMGGHFATCLSPGEFNFFSVVANAADVNKRVVYARDEQQRIVGRCLLALSDRGEILAFEPFCHDPELGFGDMMGEVVNTLARQMRSVVAIRSRVSCLLAPDWYDDGPRDLGRRFVFLEEGSDFRSSLASLEPAGLPEVLARVFEPLPLNALTLPLIVELPEVEARPELILPLLPAVERCKGLASSTLLLAARLARRAGASAFSEQVVRRRAVPYLLAQNRHGQDLDGNVMALLIELFPSMALRVLRRTRPVWVRTDEEEDWSRRRAWLAAAHEALGRTARARQLRKKA